VLAKVESLKAGYDEAIMLNDHGYVTDGSGENIFIVRKGVLFTPPTQAGSLDGITRETTMTLARDAGYEVREENLVRTDLYNAEECFFTGTAAEITPIREVDDREVGEGHRGPVTKELQSAFFAATWIRAYARSIDRTRSLKAGFQMHLSKPVQPAELAAVVLALAATSEAHRRQNRTM